VSVHDDGCGFATDARRPPDDASRGLGLSGIAERVRILGGTHVIRSLRGQGTMISLTIPLPQSSPAVEAPRAR